MKEEEVEEIPFFRSSLDFVSFIKEYTKKKNGICIVSWILFPNDDEERSVRCLTQWSLK
jgi:hypothetical protein